MFILLILFLFFFIIIIFYLPSACDYLDYIVTRLVP